MLYHAAPKREHKFKTFAQHHVTVRVGVVVGVGVVVVARIGILVGIGGGANTIRMWAKLRGKGLRFEGFFWGFAWFYGKHISVCQALLRLDKIIFLDTSNPSDAKKKIGY